MQHAVMTACLWASVRECRHALLWHVIAVSPYNEGPSYTKGTQEIVYRYSVLSVLRISVVVVYGRIALNTHLNVIVLHRSLSI